VDFKEAENIKSLFVESSIGRLHFYKGMSLYKLHSGSKGGINDEMADQILKDLGEAVRIDSTWFQPVEEVFADLHVQYEERFRVQLKTARREDTVDDKAQAFLEYVALVDKAHLFQADDGSDLLKAKAFHEIGDLYFEDSNNVASLQKAGQHFKSAIEYYEIARYNDPFSKDIIKSLLDLSKRMDDPSRVQEYSKLLELAGG
ncbi:MAG: hypothetical protein AAF391_07210, partial [Bacteroidota bacterium]